MHAPRGPWYGRRMPRTARVGVAVVAAVLCAGTLLGAAPGRAEAARRSVPFGFFGTVMPMNLFQGSDAPALGSQTALMARSGVESVRATFDWATIEPAQGVYEWSGTDRLVETTAQRRIEVLANVLTTPRWASERPGDALYYGRYAPRDPAFIAAFMRQLVARYGPRGSFWAEHPSLPRVPVRQWQIWNEQRADWFWASQPWAPTYTRFLQAAYTAVHAADPGAKVVAGSLVALGSVSTQWGQVRDLYRAGARRFFDVVAVHPFTDGSVPVRESVRRFVEIVRRVRREMRRAGDARKPIILTEISWPAARGKLPRARLLGLETTPRGQFQRLRAADATLVRQRRRLGVTQAYWYTWATPYDADSPQSDVSYRFSGLVRARSGAFAPMPVLGAYARVAARYEGCRKGADARRCR